MKVILDELKTTIMVPQIPPSFKDELEVLNLRFTSIFRAIRNGQNTLLVIHKYQQYTRTAARQLAINVNKKIDELEMAKEKVVGLTVDDFTDADFKEITNKVELAKIVAKTKEYFKKFLARFVIVDNDSLHKFLKLPLEISKTLILNNKLLNQRGNNKDDMTHLNKKIEISRLLVSDAIREIKFPDGKFYCVQFQDTFKSERQFKFFQYFFNKKADTENVYRLKKIDINMLSNANEYNYVLDNSLKEIEDYLERGVVREITYRNFYVDIEFSKEGGFLKGKIKQYSIDGNWNIASVRLKLKPFTGQLITLNRKRFLIERIKMTQSNKSANYLIHNYLIAEDTNGEFMASRYTDLTKLTILEAKPKTERPKSEFDTYKSIPVEPEIIKPNKDFAELLSLLDGKPTIEERKKILESSDSKTVPNARIGNSNQDPIVVDESVSSQKDTIQSDVLLDISPIEKEKNEFEKIKEFIKSIVDSNEKMNIEEFNKFSKARNDMYILYYESAKNLIVSPTAKKLFMDLCKTEEKFNWVSQCILTNFQNVVEIKNRFVMEMEMENSQIGGENSQIGGENSQTESLHMGNSQGDNSQNIDDFVMFNKTDRNIFPEPFDDFE
jgi:hypothetical protein